MERFNSHLGFVFNSMLAPHPALSCASDTQHQTPHSSAVVRSDAQPVLLCYFPVFGVIFANNIRKENNYFDRRTGGEWRVRDWCVDSGADGESALQSTPIVDTAGL